MTEIYDHKLRQRGRESRLFFVIAIFLTIIGGAPLVSVALAGAIASHYGCALDEGSAHVCMVGGRDIGGTLYSMGVAGWLALLTIWLLLAAPVFWIVAIVKRINERKEAGSR